MFTSRICAPPSTCCRATVSASAYCPASTSFANLGEPVTFVRSPTFTKFESGRMTKGSRPESRVSRGDLRAHARRYAPARPRRSAGCARASCRSSRPPR